MVTFTFAERGWLDRILFYNGGLCLGSSNRKVSVILLHIMWFTNIVYVDTLGIYVDF